jgi:hypothetical protein
VRRRLQKMGIIKEKEIIQIVIKVWERFLLISEGKMKSPVK